jgi:hypothetical protein
LLILVLSSSGYVVAVGERRCNVEKCFEGDKQRVILEERGR